MKIQLYVFLLSLLVSQNTITKLTINYGISTHQNQRDYQEDRFTNSAINNGQFFAIYDGHGGDKVSSFLATNLHRYFGECLKNETNKKKCF
ncbi:MAG TPA: PP2C family serine/threonine-protein phosphatase [Candidatus Babeliales bacterium]|nr:PP2C family serine/threonine-protein phosphatase [Candidatus Babeliales bacterium]